MKQFFFLKIAINGPLKYFFYFLIIFEHFPHILKNNFKSDWNVLCRLYLYEFWIIDSLVELDGFGLTFEHQVKKRHLSSYIIRTSSTTISSVESLALFRLYSENLLIWQFLNKTAISESESFWKGFKWYPSIIICVGIISHVKRW